MATHLRLRLRTFLHSFALFQQPVPAERDQGTLSGTVAWQDINMGFVDQRWVDYPTDKVSGIHRNKILLKETCL